MLKTIFAGLILIALALSFIDLDKEFDGKLEISNAFVSGRVIKLTSSVSGLIQHINVTKGDQVKQGELLFSFDVEQKNIKINNLTQILRQTLDKELKFCVEKQIVEGEIIRGKANLEYLYAKRERLNELAKNGIYPQEEIEDLANKIELEKNDLAILQTRLLYYELNQKLPLQERADVKIAINSLHQAYYDRHQHQQYAPSDGYIYEVLTYPGHNVDTGTPLAILLPNDKLFVEANVLESNLNFLQPGKEVDVMFDTAIDKSLLKGRVHSIVPATAGSFSVLPRNNTDSNWIKVAQRVPVLIEVELSKRQTMPIGTSVKVLVDKQYKAPVKTKNNPLPELDKNITEQWKQVFEQQISKVLSAELGKVNTGTYARCNIHYHD